MSGRLQVRIREVGIPAEARRREAFRALVEAQDSGTTVLTARREVARQFGLSPAIFQAIEDEGMIYDWPPLGPDETSPAVKQAARDSTVAVARCASPRPAEVKRRAVDLNSATQGQSVGREAVIACYRDRMRADWEGQLRTGKSARDSGGTP
jgi:hypothetical protein